MAEELPTPKEGRIKRTARTGLAALKEPEGLATAALATWLFGPAGILIGAAQGILAKRTRQSELDAAVAEQEMFSALDEQQQAAIAAAQAHGATDLDRAQLAQLQSTYQGIRKLTMSPDPAVRSRAAEQLASFGSNMSAWLEDVESRRESVFDENVGVLDEQADLARSAFDEGLQRAQDVTRISSELHALLSDPNFDVNSQLNRARLGQLIEQTPRQFFADPADMADALKDVGGNLGILGVIPTWIGGKMKAEDFQWTKEDWRKIAFAMTVASKKQSDRVMEDARRIGSMLDDASQRMGHVPALSYMQRIVSGQEQEGATVPGQQNYYEEIARQRAAEERAARGETGDEQKGLKQSFFDVLNNAKKAVIEFGSRHNLLKAYERQPDGSVAPVAPAAPTAPQRKKRRVNE